MKKITRFVETILAFPWTSLKWVYKKVIELLLYSILSKKREKFGYKIEDDQFYLIALLIFTITFFLVKYVPLLSPEWNISASTQTLAAITALVIAGFSFNRQSWETLKESDSEDKMEDYNEIEDENFNRFAFVIELSVITIVYNLIVLMSIKSSENSILDNWNSMHIYNSLALSISVIIVIGLFALRLFNFKRLSSKTVNRETKYDKIDSSDLHLNDFLLVYNQIEKLLLDYYEKNYKKLDINNRRLSYINRVLIKDNRLANVIPYIDELRIYRNKLVHSSDDIGINEEAYKKMKEILEIIKKFG